MTTVEKIHREVDTAQDRLLSEAKKILTTGLSPEEVISDRLIKAGFTNTPVVKKAKEIADKRVMSQEQATLIGYYANAYPFLKFLTVEEFDRICTKYSLVYAPVASYCKDVPEKNLKDIEQAQALRDRDYTNDDFFIKLSYTGDMEVDTMFKGKTIPLDIAFLVNDRVDVQDIRKALWKAGYKGFAHICQWPTYELIRHSKDGLFIAAPQSHFDTTNLKQNKLGFFAFTVKEIKDPIVFRYVQGGIQVLTKWGVEGEDPALVVPKLN